MAGSSNREGPASSDLPNRMQREDHGCSRVPGSERSHLKAHTQAGGNCIYKMPFLVGYGVGPGLYRLTALPLPQHWLREHWAWLGQEQVG